MKRSTLILMSARDVLSNQDCWGKGRLAYSHYLLQPVTFGSSHADSFCALGALNAAAIDHHCYGTPAFYRATDALYRALPKVRQWDNNSVPRFNDDPRVSHKDILRLFDRAIASLEA
jgi:hypothetical protein